MLVLGVAALVGVVGVVGVIGIVMFLLLLVLLIFWCCVQCSGLCCVFVLVLLVFC